MSIKPNLHQLKTTAISRVQFQNCIYDKVCGIDMIQSTDCNVWVHRRCTGLLQGCRSSSVHSMAPMSRLNAHTVSVIAMMERTSGQCRYASWRTICLQRQHCHGTASSTWCFPGNVQIIFTCMTNGCNKSMPIEWTTRYLSPLGELHGWSVI